MYGDAQLSYDVLPLALKEALESLSVWQLDFACLPKLT